MKAEEKAKISEKKDDSKKTDQLPPLPNLNIKEKKAEEKAKHSEKDIEGKKFKDDLNDQKDNKFKMDTSFLDID